MSSYDPYGAAYNPAIWNTDLTTAYTNLPINITTTTGTNISATAPIYLTPPIYGTVATNWTYPYYNLDPNGGTLQGPLIDSLFDKMITTVKEDEKVIVCVDLDLTQDQCEEIKEGLMERGFNGIVLRGARAGTGYAGNPQQITPEEKRVDILARIGELWELCPELKLTSLLEWWEGQEMEDEDFAAAVETYFKKVTNGYRGKP